MKLNTLRYYISLVLVLVSFLANAQDSIPPAVSADEMALDTVKPKDLYGLRVGIDLSLPIRSLINSDLKGFEIVSDFRIKKNLYVAAEIGYYDRYQEEDYIKFTTTGSYFKIGTNYNLYKNWLGMTNEIYVGFRYGFSTFSQTLNEYTPNYYGTFFPENTIETAIEANGLTAHWGEVVMGMKVEVLNNFYMGLSISLKKLFSQKQPDNFLNMYIPGFERVYLNDTGFSFNYTISYAIPLFKK